MPEWTQDQAMSQLDPIFDKLDAIGRGGLARYQQTPAELRIEHDSRAAASCVYSHMVVLADELLADQPGVVFKVINGLKVWIVGERATIRFKKMDKEGRWSNATTQQQRNFDRQLPLPGIPYPPLNLVVGYVPDPLRTEVERVQVAKPRGKAIDWCAAIIPTSEHIAGQPRWVDITRQAGFGG